MFTRVEKLISFRNLKPKKKEGFLKVISAFSFLGISLGVAILIIVMSVMNGFHTDLTNKILGLNPHLVIESNGKKIDKNFFNNFIKKYDVKVTESLGGEGIILSQLSAKGILIKGIKQEDLSDLFSKEQSINGRSLNIKKGTTVIGNELSFDLDLTIGDKITLMSSAFINTPLGGVPKKETFIISGIFNSGFIEFDRNLVFLNINDALSLFDKTEDNLNIELYLKDPMIANKIKKEIQNKKQDLFAYSWSDLNKSFFSALKIERNVMFIILTLIIIVAAFNIISGLTILIKNKTKEIAILKSLGLSNNSIKKSFFLTGFTIGFVATITGIIFGILFSIYIENIRLFFSNFFNLNIFPQDVYLLDKMPSEINIFSILVIFIFSLIINSLASYFPARAISKMEITKALKYE